MAVSNECNIFIQICSLSTIAREYIALRSIGYLPFKDLILTAKEKVSGSQYQSWKIPGSLQDFIKENHNVSQLEAIYVSCYLYGFISLSVCVYILHKLLFPSNFSLSIVKRDFYFLFFKNILVYLFYLFFAGRSIT